MKDVLVTGAGGFVGGYLCSSLLKKGYNVRALIRRSRDPTIPPTLRDSRLEIFRGDIIDYQDVVDAILGMDLLFHLASVSNVPDSIANPFYCNKVNVEGTLNILQAMREYPLKRLMFASSSEVYGHPIESEEIKMDENYPANPNQPYAATKLMGEYLCKAYHKHHGLDVVITRAFNHEGANRGHNFVTSDVIRQAVMFKLGETKRLVVGNLDARRDWSHVEDVVDAYILLAEKGKAGETYVIGSGISYSILEFIDRVKMLLSTDPPVYTTSALKRANDTRMTADASKVRKLGWEPQKNLDDIIIEMAAWYMGMTPNQRKFLNQRQEQMQIN